jgi:FkbM family methyltransferase
VAANDRVSTALERLGAHTVADQIDRVRHGGDVVAVPLPLRRKDVRSKRIKMYRHGGRDQVARAMHDNGWRGFEHPLPTMFRASVDRSRGDVIDVGANTGVYALIAAATGRRVHAFEPNPAVVPLLRANIELNRQGKRVDVIEAAVSAREGTASLFLPPPSGTTVETSASLDEAFKEEIEATVEVPVTTIDGYWRSIGRPAVGVVKIDVEGHEPAAVEGAIEVVGDCRPVLFVEVLSNVDALEDLRAQLGYVDVRLSAYEAIVGDRVRFDELAWNHAWVPPESVEPFTAAAADAELVVTYL